MSDWYSTSDSSLFTKSVFTLTARVFIDATELADVLVTGGIPFAQGFEVPTETSNETNPSCGQAWTLTFYMELLEEVRRAM